MTREEADAIAGLLYEVRPAHRAGSEAWRVICRRVAYVLASRVTDFDGQAFLLRCGFDARDLL